jgi:molybdenum cofactor guanylyltransferase
VPGCPCPYEVTALDASAVILSGGRSTRLGQDKGLLPFHGIPLIAHIASQLKPMFRDVVVSTNDPGTYAFLGLPMVADRKPGQGPLMGIATSLGHVARDLCFVIGCDIPTVNPRFVQHMVGLAEGVDIVMPRDAEGRFEPLFAVYRRSVGCAAFEMLEAGERRIAALFERVRVRFVDFDGGGWYKNINTIDDYFDAAEAPGG